MDEAAEQARDGMILRSLIEYFPFYGRKLQAIYNVT